MHDPGYRIGDHPADLELWVRGRNREEIFINSARGMLDYTVPAVTPGEPTSRQIHLTASDPEELLVVWLNELLFLLETEDICFREITITNLTDREISASLKGGKLQPEDERGPEIKAATYHQLSIKDTGDGWEAHVILDL
jgi:protein archease